MRCHWIGSPGPRARRTNRSRGPHGHGCAAGGVRTAWMTTPGPRPRCPEERDDPNVAGRCVPGCSGSVPLSARGARPGGFRRWRRYAEAPQEECESTKVRECESGTPRRMSSVVAAGDQPGRLTCTSRLQCSRTEDPRGKSRVRRLKSRLENHEIRLRGLWPAARSAATCRRMIAVRGADAQVREAPHIVWPPSPRRRTLRLSSGEFIRSRGGREVSPIRAGDVRLPSAQKGTDDESPVPLVRLPTGSAFVWLCRGRQFGAGCRVRPPAGRE